MAVASRAKLAIMTTTVTTEGSSLMKPCDCFIEYAQTTSRIPATSNEIQAMAALLTKEPGRPGACSRSGGGRPPGRRSVSCRRAAGLAAGENLVGGTGFEPVTPAV